jgi:hypothetical protein
MKNLRIIPEALDEYLRQYEFLVELNPSRAEEFRSAITEGLGAIQGSPTKFAYLPGRTFRSYGPTKKDKYRIAYIEIENTITIVAIYYSGLPDPLYWEGRAF